jgi:hypothetical protein
VAAQSAQGSSPPRTLFERAWKNDNSIRCKYLPGTNTLRIYASGKQNERNLRIDDTTDFGASQRYLIIKSNVAYCWNTNYTSKNQGCESFIDEAAIEKLLRSFQEGCLAGFLKCERWFDPDEALFELPLHTTFNNCLLLPNG